MPNGAWITYNSAGATTTGKRTYSSGSADVAFRDTASGSAQLWWTASDWQGSASVQADTATLSATAGWVRASYSPYGGQRLSGPSAWTGDRGWLGLTRDAATGLVQTGARLYDPLLQQFISPDPLLNPLAPNPYLYAGANPILFSDPTGLWFGESLWNSVVNSAPVQFAAGWHAQTVQWGISAAHTVVQAVRPGGSVSQSGRQVGAAVSSAAGKFGRDAVSSGSTQKAVGNLLGVDAAVSHGQAAIKSGQSGNWFNAGASAANAAGITASIAAIAIPAAGQLSTALRIGRYAKALANVEQATTKGIPELPVGPWGAKVIQAREKVPSSWGPGTPNSKGVGTRWFDPRNDGNGVRMDQGSPAHSYPSQQSDHVIVRSGGNILGPNGKPIVGPLRDNPQAHIPLEDWLNWTSWNSP